MKEWHGLKCDGSGIIIPYEFNYPAKRVGDKAKGDERDSRRHVRPLQRGSHR